MLDLFLEIFPIVWLPLIYLLVLYRLVYKKGKRLYQENTGLLLVSLILVYSLDYDRYLKIIFTLIGAGLLIMNLLKWRK